MDDQIISTHGPEASLQLEFLIIEHLIGRRITQEVRTMGFIRVMETRVQCIVRPINPEMFPGLGYSGRHGTETHMSALLIVLFSNLGES